ncbi:LolA-related protein [Falsiroseomonas sp. E2-1-a20]|uniref:LolA-related protein n=1 Tax=Falsiroseomonas sp. E2-1-a20 TaxID=3239300 RepID=UPI003F3636AB
MRAGRRALLLLPLAGPALAQDALAEVMRALAAVRERRSRFTEEKLIPELDIGLPNEGTLLWVAPDRLEKHTTWPIDEVLAVQDGQLRYERRDRGVQRDFALAEQPEMAALVEAIRATLAGDLPALRRHYDVAFRGPPAAWTLVLTPDALRLRGAVQRITITGEGAELRGVDTEGGGGVTRMRITPSP